MSEATQAHAAATSAWLARIHVMLKPAVLDPQGDTVLGALRHLGFADISSVRVGKYLEVRLTAPDQASAESAVDQMCARLLANPVIESYRFTVEPHEASAGGHAG